MTIEQTRARAAADIARGDAGMAVRRLGSLRAAFPDDLEVRRALRDAYRASNDLAEAGRWGYVLPDATAAEVDAFVASRGGHPSQIVSAIAWPMRKTGHPLVDARLQRLERDLSARPTPQHGATSADRPRRSFGDVMAGAGCSLAFGFVVLLLLLGAWQVATTVTAWFD